MSSMSPTTSCFSGVSAGPIRALSNNFAIEPRRRRPCVQPDREHAADVGVGLLQRHAWPEPGHTLIAEVAQEHSIAIESLRKDDVGVQHVQELKTRPA